MIQDLPNTDLKKFQYNLPEEKIAKFPLKERSDSKLLSYQKGTIEHHQFKDISKLLPENATLFFNNTRVIPARLHFYKETGALIEVFLLEPVSPTPDVASAMLIKGQCQWKCMIGNLKKWKDNIPLSLYLDEVPTISALIVDRDEQIVEFNWKSNHSFVDLLQIAGKIPLPPYIRREVSETDKERYQTVYSAQEGAVAAPTAGLHFDDKVLANLHLKGIKTDYLTLHVSAGTFQPIKSDNIMKHPMHHEQVTVTKTNLESIMASDHIIAVGTTSLRTLESLYWYGVDLLLKNKQDFHIEKLRPYVLNESLPNAKTAIKAVLDYMTDTGLDEISGSTEIFIFPGYSFKICNGLVTNYHLPGSTLILLIAAFIGEDWRKVYEEALQNNYRFLSYGDSSLLIPLPSSG